MRERELLQALAGGDGGIIVTIHHSMELANLKLPSCTIELEYHPYLKHVGETIFDAAFGLANELLKCPDIPTAVRITLRAFERRTETLK